MATAFQRLFEEDLYWAVVHTRWADEAGWQKTRVAFFGGLPAPVRWLLPPLASGDGRYLRIDGDQGLTPEQQAWAQFNSNTGPGGPGGSGDHGALTGLADDDHPQYHDDARGDARYDALGAATAAVAAHQAAAEIGRAHV